MVRGNLVVKEAAIRDAVRQAVLPLWNAYYFFTSMGRPTAKAIRRASTSPMHCALAALDVQDRYARHKECSPTPCAMTSRLTYLGVPRACATTSTC